jgi:glycosyltransferase involved in cell wall biosynthesis
MKLLFIVQRYGAEVYGGAEQFTRETATRLAARSHCVEVVTSCAVNYIDWANHYPPGETVIDGVRIHRLPVTRPRVIDVFGRLHGRALSHRWWAAPHLQREWMRQQGPLIPELGAWMAERSAGFDVNIFVTYLYYTTWAGLPHACAPTVLHPTAHDEPPIYLPLFDTVFRRADAYGFLTEEEARFVQKRFGAHRPSQVTGIGVELDRPGDPNQFRRRFGLGDRPYAACVGRIDPSKGAQELHEYFIRYRERHRNCPALVFIGEEVARLQDHPDIIKTGFVDEETRDAGLKGAELLIQPSYFESFSLVLCEAWAVGVPGLVQARSEVLLGQSRRSGGALTYRNYAEFEVALERLHSDQQLRRRMGAAGCAYVEQNYPWPKVLDRYERFLDRVVTRPLPASRKAALS